MMEEKKLSEALSKQSKQDKVKIDLPFDLNTLVNFNINFDTLKVAIEWLAKQQMEMKNQIHALEAAKAEKPVVDHQPIVFQNIVNQTPVAPIVQPVEVTQSMFLELKRQMQEYHQLIDESIEGLQDHQRIDRAKLNDLISQFDLLRKLGAPQSGGDNSAGIIDLLNDITGKLRKEFDERLDGILKRIATAEDNTKNGDADLKKRIDELSKFQNELESQINQNKDNINILKNNKVEQDEFDREIYELKNNISSLSKGQPVQIRAATPKGPKISQDDIDRWNLFAKRIDKIEMNLEKAMKDFEEIEKIKVSISLIQKKIVEFVSHEEFNILTKDVKNSKQDISELKQDVKQQQNEYEKLKNKIDSLKYPSVEEVFLIRNRVDKLESQLSSLRKSFSEFEKKLKSLGGPVVQTGADQDQVDKCFEEIHKLRADFEAHKEFSIQNINNLNYLMPTKADKQELIDLENRILDKLRDMIQQILNQFANKDDVMKRFALLSKKIREIMDLLSRQGGSNEDEAMFSKRQIGPQACASCEKNLVNMHGQQADYHAWKKLPFRDPTERIARYGQGFSKILSHMRPNDYNNSPGRNHHINSIDDSIMMTPGPEIQRKTNTHNGFFRNGTTGNAERKMSSNQKGHQQSTTGPGSSIDEGINSIQEGNDIINKYMKSPGLPQNTRFNTNKNAGEGALHSAEILPKLATIRGQNNISK